MIALQRRFLEEYHWHSGKPLESAIWSQTQETAIMLSKYQTPSQLLACSFLRKYHKRKITEALRQCRDRQLVSNRADADRHLAEVCSNAVSALKDYKPRMEALNSRALQVYATSLSNTTFINRSGSVAAGPAASKPVKPKKKTAVASRGAEQIREQNKLRQASKNQVCIVQKLLADNRLDFCPRPAGANACAAYIGCATRPCLRYLLRFRRSRARLEAFLTLNMHAIRRMNSTVI